MTASTTRDPMTGGPPVQRHPGGPAVPVVGVRSDAAPGVAETVVLEISVADTAVLEQPPAARTGTSAIRPATLADLVPSPRRPVPDEMDDAPWAGEPVASRAAVPMPPGADADVLLPPPTDAEKLLYRKRRLWVLTGASLVSFTALVVSQVMFLRMSTWLWLFVPAFAFTVVYYLVSLAVNTGTPGFDMQRHQRLVSAWHPDEYPSVDVFLPVCGEAIEVLHNTWRHVHRMALTYPGRVHVYVLDDSSSNERERMALAFGFVYQRRPNRGWYKKAGNMRYAYQRTLGSAILVLDADFTPRADLLGELLPYFDAEPDLGIIQSPQFFRVTRHQGWLERGAGAVQELFYRSVQVSRQAHEAAICVGSCAIYRRTALDDIGGSTLIEHSEDVHTGFDMRRKGWRLRYVPVPLAVGLCPGDASSFFTQQYRWCAGSMSLLSSTKFWNLDMSWRQRLSYVSGFCYYLHTALFTFAGPLIPIVMLLAFPRFVRLDHYLLILPSVLYNFVVFPLWHKTRYRLESWTVKILYGWSHAFAIWDLLRGQAMGWQPTGGTAKKSRTRRLWVALILWSLGTALVWTLTAAFRMSTIDVWTFTPAFLAGAIYLTTVLQALLVDPEKDIPRRRAPA